MIAQGEKKGPLPASPVEKKFDRGGDQTFPLSNSFIVWPAPSFCIILAWQACSRSNFWSDQAMSFNADAWVKVPAIWPRCRSG